MLSKRINCWEYYKCGREPNRKKVYKSGICHAATDCKYNGLHGGINGGRFCWVVVGSFGRREQLCREECSSCPFLLLVEKEEGRYFEIINDNDLK